ncbi:LIC12162 family protein [Flavobacteriales bacterium]|nr:LIC12162 family protein [Flavobacteriales bacterium]
MTSGYALSVLPDYMDYLNKKHKVFYSLKFWKTLVYPWLATIVQVLYERQTMVLSFVDKYKDEPLRVKLIRKESVPTVRDTFHLQSVLSSSPSFNHWCFSRIIEEIAPDSWEIEYVDYNFSDEESPKLSTTSLKYKFKEGLNKIINILAPRCSNVYGMSIFDRIYFSFFLFLKRPIKSIGLEIDKDEENIQGKELKWIFNFKEILETTFPEDLKALNLKDKIKAKKGKIQLFSNDLYYDLESKIKAASKKEGGEVIIPSQHGGYMIGSGYVNEVITNIELKQNYFFSWGWKHPDIQSIIPLPSPLLSKMIDSHQEKNSTVILITTASLFYYHRYNTGLSPHYMFNYRSDRVDFVKQLKEEIRSELLYRPYPESNRSLSDSSYMLDKIPNLKILKGRNIHNKLLECRLLIMDNPSTTVTIAMAANIPLIIVFDPIYFPFTGDMKKEIAKLQKVAIYHPSIASASSFVNANYNNIQTWWKSEAVQTVRKEFSRKYAWAEKNWRSHWRKQLSTIDK